MIRLKDPEHRPTRGRRPKYQPGQIIRHHRYGYRGVVVDTDPRCQADDAWYQSNQTQPDRDQPWYHILIDHSTKTTYAAEDNLRADGDSDQPVVHPLVHHFFSGFADGRHERNGKAWPGAWGEP